MAATLTNQKVIMNVPHVVETGEYSTLQEGVTVTHTHLGPSGVEPTKVEFVTTVRPGTRDPITCVWVEADNDTTNNYVYFQFDTVDGGDLTTGKVRYWITWHAHASGGIS